jgi:hypothetical protein
MTEYQRIATGLLGLKHPETYTMSSCQKSAMTLEFAPDKRPAASGRPREGQYARAMRAIRFVLAALAIGSRTVALADNSQLRRDLVARADLLYGPDED